MAEGGNTVDELRELADQLAGRAAALAADLDTAHGERFAVADALIRRAGYRLPDAAGQLRQVAADLRATVLELAQLAARTESTCPAQWGCCPDHGGTLRSSGGRCWCTAPGCGREWDYDRDGRPCTEPAAFEVRGIGDQADAWGRLCAGHTRTAREQIDGVQVRPLAVPA